MRQMMLDGVEFPAGCFAREGLFQKTANVRPRAAITDPAKHQIDIWDAWSGNTQFCARVGAIVLIERDMVHIGEL